MQANLTLNTKNNVKTFMDLLINTHFIGENRKLNVSDLIVANTMDPRAGRSQFPYSFVGHEYQLDWLNDMAYRSVVKKCAQIGISEAAIRKFLILSYFYGLNVAYAMPTQVSMRVFKGNRIDPVIRNSPKLSRGWIKDNFDFTNWNTGGIFYYIHSKTNTGNYGTSLDAVLLDEYNRLESRFVQAVPQRLGHSLYKIRNEICTPTFPGIGISARYDKSDQKVRKIKCDSCNEWQTLSFLNIFFKKGLIGLPDFHLEMPERSGVEQEVFCNKYLDREPYTGCIKCNRKLDRIGGRKEWVPKFPKIALSGWALNRLHVPRRDELGVPCAWNEPGIGHNAGNLVVDFFDAESISEYVNQAWGEDFSTGEEAIILDDLKSCMVAKDSFLNTFLHSSSGPCFMGIDQKSILNITVLLKQNKKLFLVYASEYTMIRKGDSKTGVVQAVQYIKNIVKRFNVRMLSIEAQPDLSLPHALSLEFTTRTIVTTQSSVLKKYFTVPSHNNTKDRTCTVNRTWGLDKLKDMFKGMSHDYSIYLPYDLLISKEGSKVAAHLQSMVRTDIEVQDSKTDEVFKQPVWKTQAGKRDDYMLSCQNAILAIYIYLANPKNISTASIYPTSPMLITSPRLLGGRSGSY